jgi:hypothetical protein
VLLFLSTMASAKVNTSALYRSYDDGETQVVSPSLDVVWVTNGERLEVGVGFAQDILTSASSDVRSYSSQTAISDRRTEGSLVTSLQMEEGKVGWSLVHSEENDYDSNTIAFAGTRDFFEKNTTFFSSFAYGEDKISTAKDKENYRLMNHETYSLSLTQLLSQNSLVQLLVDYKIESGYLGSPYRQARKFNSDGSGTVVTLPENMPLTRNRTTLTAKYNYFFSDWKMTTSTSGRMYFDSWGLKSSTLEGRLGKEFGDKFELAFNARYYVQTQASFYQDIYTEIGPFYTGNKTLSNLNSMLLGISPSMKLFETLNIFVKYEYYRVNYTNHTDVGRLSDKSDDKALAIIANIMSVGVQGEF